MILSIFQCSWFQPSSQPWSSNALRGGSEGCGYRPRKQGEEDDPLLVVGVKTRKSHVTATPAAGHVLGGKSMYLGAIDPSLGQAISFPSLLQLKLRIEVPLWRNVAETSRWKSRVQTRLWVKRTVAQTCTTSASGRRRTAGSPNRSSN